MLEHWAAILLRNQHRKPYHKHGFLRLTLRAVFHVRPGRSEMVLLVERRDVLGIVEGFRFRRVDALVPGDDGLLRLSTFAVFGALLAKGETVVFGNERDRLEAVDWG